MASFGTVSAPCSSSAVSMSLARAFAASPSTAARSPSSCGVSVAPQASTGMSSSSSSCSQDQGGFQLAGGGVEAGVQDPRVGPARAEGEPLLGLQQQRAGPDPRERVCHGGANDAAADDRDGGIHAAHRPGGAPTGAN